VGIAVDLGSGSAILRAEEEYTMRIGLACVIGLGLVAACGGSEDSGPADASFTTGTYTVTWGPYTAMPGEEGTKCIDVSLKNPDNIQVHEIHNNLGDASHHFIVYRKSTGVENTTPTDCVPFVGTLNPANGAPLMITQKAEETLTLPENVVFTLKPDQLVRLEMHYVNTTDAPIQVMATAEFRTQLDATMEADFLFAGTPDIDLASGTQTQTVGPVFLPFVPSLADVNIFAVTGHTHKMGTDVKVAISTGLNDPGQSIYEPETFSWDEPETARLTPALNIQPGAGGFRFSCDYVNTTGRRIGFGENADDEMCFFWLYYYPSKGAKICFHTEQQGGHDLCCPPDEGSDDAVLCALIQNYFP
jgi:hypothetical protein